MDYAISFCTNTKRISLYPRLLGFKINNIYTIGYLSIFEDPFNLRPTFFCNSVRLCMMNDKRDLEYGAAAEFS